MKKLFCILMLVTAICALVACTSGDETADTSTASPAPSVTDSKASAANGEEESKSPAAAQSSDGIDVDLTKLSSTMVYSEVYNMMSVPESYIGKTVKMNGQFSYYQDPNTKNQYFACIIADATACCSQGLEFTLSGEHTYPNDYPEPGSVVTVTGTFEVYEEDGSRYCRLANSALEA